MKKTDTTCICSYDANYGCHGHAMAVIPWPVPYLPYEKFPNMKWGDLSFRWQ